MSGNSIKQPSSFVPLLNLRDLHKSPVEPLNDTAFISNDGLNESKLVGIFPVTSGTSPGGHIHLGSLE